MARETLTANVNIQKPDGTGFWSPGETFFADELYDKGAFLKAAGHASSSVAEPPPVEEAQSDVKKENGDLKRQIGRLEAFRKRVQAHVETLPEDQKAAFFEAVNGKAKPDEKGEDKPEDEKGEDK